MKNPFTNFFAQQYNFIDVCMVLAASHAVRYFAEQFSG